MTFILKIRKSLNKNLISIRLIKYEKNHDFEDDLEAVPGDDPNLDCLGLSSQGNLHDYEVAGLHLVPILCIVST